jgi:hypothetical protein
MMSNEESPAERMARLRIRRSRLAESRLASVARTAHGPAIAAQFRHAVGRDVVLDDFDPSLDPPVVFEGRTIEEASDWTLLHVDESDALAAMSALGHCITSREGLLGIQGNNYLGLLHSASVSLSGLLHVARLLEDSIVFFPALHATAIVVDCYHGPAQRDFFSFYVKGPELAKCIRSTVGLRTNFQEG